MRVDDDSSTCDHYCKSLQGGHYLAGQLAGTWDTATQKHHWDRCRCRSQIAATADCKSNKVSEIVHGEDKFCHYDICTVPSP